MAGDLVDGLVAIAAIDPWLAARIVADFVSLAQTARATQADAAAGAAPATDEPGDEQQQQQQQWVQWVDQAVRSVLSFVSRADVTPGMRLAAWRPLSFGAMSRGMQSEVLSQPAALVPDDVRRQGVAVVFKVIYPALFLAFCLILVLGSWCSHCGLNNRATRIPRVPRIDDLAVGDTAESNGGYGGSHCSC